MLATELPVRQPPVPQRRPQDHLGLGLVLTELAGEFEEGGRQGSVVRPAVARPSPHPQPLSRGERGRSAAPLSSRKRGYANTAPLSFRERGYANAAPLSLWERGWG